MSKNPGADFSAATLFHFFKVQLESLSQAKPFKLDVVQFVTLPGMELFCYVALQTCPSLQTTSRSTKCVNIPKETPKCVSISAFFLCRQA